MPLISLVFNGIMAVVLGFIAYKYKRKEKTEDIEHVKKESDRDRDRDLYLKTLEITQNQVNDLRSELTLTKAAHDKQIDSMHKQVDELKEKVSTLKTNILTMSMFGTDGPTAMWAKDTTGRRTWHNREYEKLTGYKLADCMTKTDFEITGNKKVAQAWALNDRAVMDRNIYVVTVEPCFHKSSPEDIFYILVIKWPRRMGSHVVGVDGTAHRMDEILKAIEDSKSV